MKNLYNKLALAGTSLFVGASAFAQEAGGDVDYTSVIAAVDFSALVPVVLSVAAVLIGHRLIINNIGAIISFIGRKTSK